MEQSLLLTLEHESPKDCIKNADSALEGLEWGQDFAFLISFKVILMLGVPGSKHSENWALDNMTLNLESTLKLVEVKLFVFFPFLSLSLSV